MNINRIIPSTETIIYYTGLAVGVAYGLIPEMNLATSLFSFSILAPKVGDFAKRFIQPRFGERWAILANKIIKIGLPLSIAFWGDFGLSASYSLTHLHIYINQNLTKLNYRIRTVLIGVFSLIGLHQVTGVYSLRQKIGYLGSELKNIVNPIIELTFSLSLAEFGLGREAFFQRIKSYFSNTKLVFCSGNSCFKMKESMIKKLPEINLDLEKLTRKLRDCVILKNSKIASYENGTRTTCLPFYEQVAPLEIEIVL